MKKRDALFDFDDCLDNLSMISERYAEIKMFSTLDDQKYNEEVE